MDPRASTLAPGAQVASIAQDPRIILEIKGTNVQFLYLQIHKTDRSSTLPPPIGSTLRSQLLRIPTKMAESQPFSLYKSCDYLLCCTSGEPLRRNNILPTNERMQIEEASIKWRLLTGLISGLQRTRTLPFLWLHSIPCKDPQLEVNFYTGTDEDSDIAFQFRLHFGHPAIMNSRVFGIWRYEEKCYYLPFEDGKPFELCIYVRHKEYKVMVNGQRIYNFAHRFPPASVKMLQVLRDISLTRVLISD
ncbi:galectin-9 isoform X6 [Macaca mulatta]